jgi:tripartite-type tricarboxylate transporter receptor subunit TctC
VPISQLGAIEKTWTSSVLDLALARGWHVLCALGCVDPATGLRAVAVLARNDAYFIPEQPYLDRIEIRVYPDNSSETSALISGEVSIMFATVTSIQPQIKAGRVRALGVTGLKRTPVLPDVPTIAEAGVAGYNADLWFCLTGPAGLPAAIATRIADDLAKVVKLPEVKDRLDQQGMEATPGAPAALRPFLAEQNAQWLKVVRAAGVKAD